MHGQFPARPATSRRRLSTLGLRPKKRLSQSFLEDERVAAAIVRASEIKAGGEVLEVGPGLGVLTRLLVRRASRVVAVELDSDLADALRAEMPETVEVVNQDVLKFDPKLGRLYVATEAGGVSMFDESGRSLKRAGVIAAPHAHTVALDPATHRIYLPLQNVDGRPALRIMAPS